MTPEEKTKLVGTAGKNLAAVLGRELVVQWPTPGDLFTIDEKMVEIAARGCLSPLAHVHAIPAKLLAGEDRLHAIAVAVEKGAGGGATPNGMLIGRAYNSLEGLRYRLWRLTRRTHPDLTEEDVAALVTEANR